MIRLEGYEILNELCENDDVIVYQVKRESDHEALIFKFLKDEYPSLEKTSKFLHGYEVSKTLKEAGIINICELINYRNSFILVLEDFGQNLHEYLRSKKVQLSEALVMFIKITEYLDKIHEQHIIHKDINPSNIIINTKTTELTIIDFDISTNLSKETLSIKSLNQLEGSLAYISPEQTGRMNRGVDYRSDFYSLGITFYQIITGVLPFQSKDTLELVHAHMAKIPIPPHQVNFSIPQQISHIIMKLLAKTAEDRYQSAYGIIADLKEAQLQLQKKGEINEFPLGTKDLSGRFQIPEKLYGRENEIEFLMNLFSQVSRGNSKLLLVAGYSGVGKSSLLHEIHKPIVEKKGYFISGKFDLLKRNIPYAPFIQALENLVYQILTEGEQQISQWKNILLKALGSNVAVICEVLPSLINIVGAQPPLLELGPTETQNRFISVFQVFFKVICTEEHPIVIFLDDLQWVDLPSLKLLEALVEIPDIKYLLIIGAYRDNEVNPSHPLTVTLENLKNRDISYETLSLSPLKINDVKQLLSDTLQQNPENVQPLASLCHVKTLGNPFFLYQFLRLLCEENLIFFDKDQVAWHWDIEKIRTHSSASNVVSLVADNIEKLLPESKHLLTYAACVGNNFDLQVLTHLKGSSPREILHSLSEALQENYILPLDESYRYVSQSENANAFFKFLHDRVQQAAYSLLPDTQKQEIHFQIGKYYIKNLSQAEQDEKLFEIVNQFNLAETLVTDPEEKNELAKLNLKAGKKAKTSSAYLVGFNYLQSALNCLSTDSWITNYSLSLEVFSLAAELAYLSDNFIVSKQLADEALKHTKTIIDQVNLYETKIYTEIAQNNPATAVEIAIEVLAKLNVKFPKKPNTFHVLFSLIKTKLLLMGKKEDRLINLPETQNPLMHAACHVLSSATAPAYFATPSMFPLFSFALLNLSIRYGYNRGTASSYASYGIILCGVTGDIETGYLFGQYAQKLVEKYNFAESDAKIALMTNGFIYHWKDPFRSVLAPLLVAHFRGVEIGDLEFSTYSAYFYMVCSFYAGVELNTIANDMQRFCEFSKYHHTHKPVFYSMTVLSQVIENLMGLSENPSILIGNSFNETTQLQEAIDCNNNFGLYSLYVVKTILNYLFYQHEEAYKASLMVPLYEKSATSSAPVKVFNFYDSLNRLMLCEKLPADRKMHLKKVAENQKKLKHWMKFSPSNCAHKYFLVEAERARLQKNDAKAGEYYDQAVKLAKEHEFLQEYALACELVAKFYLAQNKEMIAKGYMKEAYFAYNKWGAKAKLQHLEKEYHQLIKTPSAKTGKKSTITSNASENILDISTIVKASQVISREIILSNLLERLMNFVIENAGAEKGCLILSKNEQWFIEAYVDKEKTEVLQDLNLKDHVPESIIQFVLHSKEFAILDDATKSVKYLSDPYIQENNPKSILCIPLLSQGNVTGILYLENNLTIGAFTKDRVELLNLLSAQIVFSLENARLYNNMLELNKAYEHFIPKEFLNELSKKNIVDVHLGDHVEKDMTVLFCDIRDFTAISEKLTPEENFAFVNNFLTLLVPIISRFGGFVDKYIGDAIMAIYPSSTDNALMSAIHMLKSIMQYNDDHPEQMRIEIGIGLNSGPLMLGIVGSEDHMEGTVISDVVNLASRTEDLTKMYKSPLLINEETYKRLVNPNVYSIRRLGTIRVKGKSIPSTIFEVFDCDGDFIKNLKLKTRHEFEQGVAYFIEDNYENAAKSFKNVLDINPLDHASQLYLKNSIENLNKNKMKIE